MAPVRPLALTLALLLPPARSLAQTDAPDSIIRAAIGMERIRGTGERGMGGPAVFTPDGRAFSVVFTRGMLDRNATEYHLRLFVRDRQTQQVTPSSVLRLSSFGNEPAIAAVQWQPDGHTVAFLGAVDHGTPQVYTFDTRTRRLTQRTAHPTPILDYDLSNDGTTIVYLAREAADLRARARQRMLGVVAREGEPGSDFDSDEPLTPNVAVVVQRRGDTRGRTVSVLPAYDSTHYARFVETIRLSPDARYAVFARYLPPTISDRWRGADNPAARDFIADRQKAPPTYGLVDLTSGTVRPLMDAPAAPKGAAVSWAPTLSRVAVTGYLPLDAADSTTLRVARSAGALVEVAVPSGRATLIKEGVWHLMAWSPSGDTVKLGDDQAGLRGDTTTSYVTLVRRDGRWVQIDSAKIPLPAIFARHTLINGLSLSPTTMVGIAQTLDGPPELGVYELSTRQARIVTRFNDRLRSLPRGQIEDAHWTTPQGIGWRGHLVKPHGYTPGQRYPAVVMIMDMSYCDTYVLDGRFYRASYPVQALASQGIAVLMVYFPPEFFDNYVAPAERSIILSGTDGAVRYLVDGGIVDSSRIAITGFSHAGYVTEYALQQSEFDYAAAVAIDNWDASYLGYALMTFSGHWIAHERFYGGTPYGPAREQWFEHAIGFNPGRVRTPLLLETHNPHRSAEGGARIWSWEVYAGLKRFGKPVELVRYAYAEHTMLKPVEQFSAATRQVDWLRFWLQGYEDSSSDKAAQYVRWRRLRTQQEQNAPAVALPAVDREVDSKP